MTIKATCKVRAWIRRLLEEKHRSIYLIYLRPFQLSSSTNFPYRHPIRTSSEVLFLCLLFLITLQLHYFNRCSSPQLHYFIVFSYIILIFYIILSFYNIVILPARCGPGPCNQLLVVLVIMSLMYYVVIILSYYNQPLYGRRLGKGKRRPN